MFKNIFVIFSLLTVGFFMLVLVVSLSDWMMLKVAVHIGRDLAVLLTTPVVFLVIAVMAAILLKIVEKVS